MTQNLKSLHSFHDSCRLNGVTPSTDVIHAKEILAEERDAEELKVEEGSRVLEILRVRKADGVPVVLERNRFSMAYSYLEGQDLQGSLYSLLREYGVEPKLALHDISLCFATEEEANWLKVKPKAPLVRLHEVIYDQKGRPLHNSIQLIRGEQFVFRI